MNSPRLPSDTKSTTDVRQDVGQVFANSKVSARYGPAERDEGEIWLRWFWLGLGFIVLWGSFVMFGWHDYGRGKPPRYPVSANEWVDLAIDFVIPPLVALVGWKLLARSRLREQMKALPPTTIAIINPLRWRLEHQLALMVACALGVALGMFYGFTHSPFAAVGVDSGKNFLLWLARPGFYWHWALSGAVMAGLTFYLVRLLRA
jgi:hypothetical protein